MIVTSCTILPMDSVRNFLVFSLIQFNQMSCFSLQIYVDQSTNTDRRKSSKICENFLQFSRVQFPFRLAFCCNATNISQTFNLKIGSRS